jgi:hypothetical protein
MIANARHQFVVGQKRALYGNRGEPYHFAGQTLRYLPGTRPIRLHYIHSNNAVNRYDAVAGNRAGSPPQRRRYCHWTLGLITASTVSLWEPNTG